MNVMTCDLWFPYVKVRHISGSRAFFFVFDFLFVLFKMVFCYFSFLLFMTCLLRLSETFFFNPSKHRFAIAGTTYMFASTHSCIYTHNLTKFAGSVLFIVSK